MARVSEQRPRLRSASCDATHTSIGHSDHGIHSSAEEGDRVDCRSTSAVTTMCTVQSKPPSLQRLPAMPPLHKGR